MKTVLFGRGGAEKSTILSCIVEIPGRYGVLNRDISNIEDYRKILSHGHAMVRPELGGSWPVIAIDILWCCRALGWRETGTCLMGQKLLLRELARSVYKCCNCGERVKRQKRKELGRNSRVVLLFSADVRLFPLTIAPACAPQLINSPAP